MAPKKNKVSLADFLADKSTGTVDWADDFDDLPAAPLNRPERTIPQRRGDDWLSSMPDRADRDKAMGAAGARPPMGASGFDRMTSIPPREELPLPTNPPFTAFIGNLAFDLTDGDVSDFFAPNQVTSVRLVSGPDGRPKGFGYVEFETLDGLKDALTRTGGNLVNRPVRVSVAESRDVKSGFGSSAAEEASQWRRAGPLPPTDGPSRRPGGDRPGFGSRFESSGSGFDNMEIGAGGRSGFGSRFAPSAPREDRPPRVVEPLEPSAGDNASDWRTGKPVSEDRRRPGASPAGERSSFTRRTEGGEAEKEFAGIGAKFVATPPESPAAGKRPGFGFDRKSSAGPAGIAAPAGPSESADTWRSSAARRTSEQESSSPSTQPAQPAQRKKLELKPRSAPVEGDAAATTEAPSASGKANPFGSARPITTADREKEIEAKMAQREKDRKDEERRRKEKQKNEREKLGAPTEPRADRSKSRSASASDRKKAPAAKSEDVGSASPQTKENGAEETEKSAAPKELPPTGAWGGGRKPSGALVTPSASLQDENGVDGDVATQTNGNANTEAGVDKLTKEAELVAIE